MFNIGIKSEIYLWKKITLSIVFCISIGLINSYSQKKDYPEPEKITFSDFSADDDRSVCLWYRSLFSFPYAYSDGTSGARDYLFTLKNETYLRILLNKNDTSYKFFALHKSCNIIPKLNSIECYYLNNKEITSRSKGEESVLIINYFEKGYYFDLSSLKDNESNVIVDLKFTYTLKSKNEISCYIDRNNDYKYLYIRMDVPEIYKYKVRYDFDILTEEIKKPRDGPIIGWYPPSFVHMNVRFVNKRHIDLMMRPTTFPDGTPNNSTRYWSTGTFRCKVQAYIFKSIKYIDHQSDSTEDSIPTIISFHLAEINEIRE